MKNVLITGGLGFQGTNLTRRLLNLGYNVTIINTPSDDAQKNYAWLKNNVSCKNLQVLWGSITDLESITRIIPKVDVIFHLAAKINVDESIENPDVFYETNIKGTYQILNLAKKHGIRVIIASTCEVFGGGENLDENSLLNPASPYGGSKAAADRIAYSYNIAYNLPIDIVRPFNVYGPLQKEKGRGAVIAMFFNKIINDEILEIHGDGEQKRDFIYIDNVIDGYISILQNTNQNKCRVWSFGTGVATSVNELVRLMCNITGKTAKIRHVKNRKGQIDIFTAKNTLTNMFNIQMIPINVGLYKYYTFRFGDKK